MTRQDLVDYLNKLGCEIVILPEGRARVVMYKNPKTNGRAFVHSPIDETRIERLTVCKICIALGVEIPPYGVPAIQLNEEIDNHINHNNKKKR